MWGSRRVQINGLLWEEGRRKDRGRYEEVEEGRGERRKEERWREGRGTNSGKKGKREDERIKVEEEVIHRSQSKPYTDIYTITTLLQLVRSLFSRAEDPLRQCQR